MTKIYVTLGTNSLARDTNKVARLIGVSPTDVRHNGGKVCVVTVPHDSLTATIEASCDSAYQVKSYETRTS